MAKQAFMAVVTLIVLAACIAGPAPKDRFYRLNWYGPILDDQQGQMLPGSLRVDRPSAVGIYAERPIAYSRSHKSAQLGQYGFDLWLDNPSDLLHRALLDGLRSTQAAQAVYSPKEQAVTDFVLKTQLLRLEHARNSEQPEKSHIVLLMEISLINQAGELQQRWRISRSHSCEDDVAAAADAAQTLLNLAILELATEMRMVAAE